MNAGVRAPDTFGVSSYLAVYVTYVRYCLYYVRVRVGGDFFFNCETMKNQNRGMRNE